MNSQRGQKAAPNTLLAAGNPNGACAPHSLKRPWLRSLKAKVMEEQVALSRAKRRKQQAEFTSSLASRQAAGRPPLQWRTDGRKTGSKQVPLRAASSEEEDEVHENDKRQGNMELGHQRRAAQAKSPKCAQPAVCGPRGRSWQCEVQNPTSSHPRLRATRAPLTCFHATASASSCPKKAHFDGHSKRHKAVPSFVRMRFSRADGVSPRRDWE